MPDDDVKWWHLAICKGMNDPDPKKKPHDHEDPFYEAYEDDPVLAATMDSICKACPVRAMCLREGVENKESGLWGGVFLLSGKMDPARNAHKTPEDWTDIRRLIAS